MKLPEIPGKIIAQIAMAPQRKIKNRFVGVSYEELIDSIKSINGASLKLLFTGKIAAFWKAINANFLLAIVAGIGISIFSLAKLITWLLVTHPILVWAFFFGLVLASTWFVSKDIKQWNWKSILSFIIGAIRQLCRPIRREQHRLRPYPCLSKVGDRSLLDFCPLLVIIVLIIEEFLCQIFRRDMFAQQLLLHIAEVDT